MRNGRFDAAACRLKRGTMLLPENDGLIRGAMTRRPLSGQSPG